MAGPDRRRPAQPLVAALRARRAGLRRGGPRQPDRADRLRGFRDALRERGVDGFVLMRTDEHGSEYLPGYAERVAWLTGFTGSAAQAVVLMDGAAVLSDGRYTVQLEQEVDPALFERRHFGRPAAERAGWRSTCRRVPGSATTLGSPAGPSATGWRPWPRPRAARSSRSTPTRSTRSGPIARRARSPRCACTRSATPARQRRQARADRGKRPGKKGADALLLTAADSIAWLLNVRGGDIPFNPLVLSYALLDQDGTCRWFVDPRKLPAA